MEDLGRPPTIVAKLDPKNLSIQRQFSCFTAVTIVEALWWINLETLSMKAGWTKLTTDQSSAIGTDEAPTCVDVS